MARTQEELREELRSLGPHWMRELGDVAEAILQSIAAQNELVEGAVETLHERTFIENSDGSWLDEHGRERKMLRRDGESDEDYRPRVRAIPEVVTPVAIKAAVDAVLLVGECRLEEHLSDLAFADNCFADNCVAYDGLRAFTVYVPAQLQSRSDTFAIAGPMPSLPASWRAFASDELVTPGTRHAFAESEELVSGAVYARIIDEIERTRPGGVSYRVVVEV